MAKWGNVDFRQLQRMAKKMEKLERAGFDKFCEDCAKDLAARLLAKVIDKTLPGIYPASTGKVGGTLRRGWTAKTHTEAESGSGSGANPKVYAETLNIKKVGNLYEVEIINPVNYASYLEYGHRTRNHKGFVKGRFMLTVSEDELNGEKSQIIDKKLKKFLGGVFDAD